MDANTQELLDRMSERYHIPLRSSLAGCTPSAKFIESIPISHARRLQVIGLLEEDPPHELILAIGSEEGLDQIDLMDRILGICSKPILAPPEEILSAINHVYQSRESQVESVAQIETDGSDHPESIDDVMREDLLDGDGKAPVIRLVNSLLFEAVRQQASDIHLHPYEDRLIARLRIDGILFDAYTLPKSIQEEVTSRIKVLGQMDIAEKRLPQDGRATVQLGDRLVDLRISSMPTSFGERIVARLLDKSVRLFRLTDLGMKGALLESFQSLLAFENGLILVTGPTGSGKSTTLYAALQEIDRLEKNIVTLEDPIEYQLEGISQVQVSEKRGMTFARGLRSVVRQDPDVIMVGEIRDTETAQMAIQASLTGHLVFSTLHTNSASSAVTRLLDLGVEPYLVASTVAGVLAQRLVRRICPECAISIAPSEIDRRRHHLPDDVMIKRGAGCARCRQTGFRGRLGIFEFLIVNEAVRELIQSSATATQIEKQAIGQGMQLLSEHGRIRILDGETTPDEVARVTTRSSL
ncbi:Flp pilus assembly complex ATPase component TadA [bacterium]|nr:Flp pilus assembly complex ATPase component TadA [bacterium]